jgi:hypothetical protein
MDYFWCGIYIGDIILLEDGYYHLWIDSHRAGTSSQEYHQAIADKLKELNEEWNEKVQKEGDRTFDGGHPPEES